MDNKEPILIDANSVASKLQKCCADCGLLQTPDCGDGCDIYHALVILEREPPVDARLVKHGYWKAVTESEISGWDVSLTGGYDPIALYVCSECGEDNIIDEFGENFLPKYCPFCGARLMNNYMEDDNDE